MRTDKRAARVVARDLADSVMGSAWGLFDDRIRGAMIDAAVMKWVRFATSADAEKPLTPSELIAFRDAVEEQLAQKPHGLKTDERREQERNAKAALAYLYEDP